MLQASFERVLATAERDHLALIRYRVPKEVDGKRVTEDRYWSATHTPVLDERGNVEFIVQHTPLPHDEQLHAAVVEKVAKFFGLERADRLLQQMLRELRLEGIHSTSDLERLAALLETRDGFEATVGTVLAVMASMRRAQRR